jgi:hypothetical protein
MANYFIGTPNVENLFSFRPKLFRDAPIRCRYFGSQGDGRLSTEHAPISHSAAQNLQSSL